MPECYVGLDAHSKQCVFAIQDPAGATLAQGAVPTTLAGLAELREVHHVPAGTPVALETGTMAFFVARQLGRLELVAVVVDAHEVRVKAHRPFQKSDQRDAVEICEGLRRGIYRSIVHVPPEAITVLRESLSRRRHFVRLQTAEVNAVKRLLRGAGLGSLTRGSLRTEAGWDRLEAQLHGEPLLCAYIRQHRAVWACAHQQVQALVALLAEQQTPFASELKRLQSVPGVGPIVALTVLAVFSDASRFPTAKHAASYSGLVPTTNQSGERDAHGHISRRGSQELRAMLCEAAHQARGADHPLNPYFRSLCARHGYKMAIVAVAHRLARILWSMLRHGRSFEVDRLGVEVGRFEKKAPVWQYRRKPMEAVRP